MARPLAEALKERGLSVWIDETEITVGDSLRQVIDRGLAESRFGVVILSPAFMAKHWPARELDALAARESDGTKVILPVWHGVEQTEIAQFSPMLADRVSVSTNLGVDEVADRLLDAVSRDLISMESTATQHLIGPSRQPAQRFTNSRRLLLTFALVGIAIGLVYLLYLASGLYSPRLTPTPETPQWIPMGGVIILNSDPDDYVGGGNINTLTDKDGKITAQLRDDGVTIEFDGEELWNFEFLAPQGRELTTGVFENAQRSAFRNPLLPGIDASGAGRGCNELIGRFVINRIVGEPSTGLKSIDLDFFQRCEKEPVGLSGSIKLHAKTSPAEPQPK